MGYAEVPLAQVLQMLENDKTAYVEKGESMYYGLKDPTPAGMYDNIFYATAEQDDLIQLNEYAYRIQLEQDGRNSSFTKMASLSSRDLMTVRIFFMPLSFSSFVTHC